VADVFGWIGATRRERVRTLVAADVQAWMAAWSRNPSAVVVEEMGADDVAPGELIAAGEVAVGAAVSLAALGAGVANIVDTQNPLATHLGERLMTDLLARLSGLAGAGDAVTWAGLSRDLRETRMGAMHLVIRLAHGDLLIALGRRQVDRRAPVVIRERSLSVVSRRSAIDGLMAGLRVELDLGEVTLGDARALSPGDVLVTQVPLAKWADIFVAAQTQPRLRGRPGRAGGHRAVAIELLEARNSEHE
jgi:Type III flagellar switch regulator (C-ring) FliN C-term